MADAIAELDDFVEREIVLVLTNDGDWYKRAFPHRDRGDYLLFCAESDVWVTRLLHAAKRMKTPRLVARCILALWHAYPDCPRVPVNSLGQVELWNKHENLVGQANRDLSQPQQADPALSPVAAVNKHILAYYVRSMARNSEWLDHAKPRTSTYGHFRSASWKFIERLESESLDPIPHYVKRRTVTTLWTYFGRLPCPSWQQDVVAVHESNAVIAAKAGAGDQADLEEQAADIAVHMSNAETLLEQVETSLTQTTQETQLRNLIMSKAFNTAVSKTIYGQSVESMKDEDFIAAIKKVDNEIASMKQVSGSVKADKLLADLIAQRADIVAAFDAS